MEEAKKVGFRRGLNVGLLTVTIPAGLFIILRSLHDIAFLEEFRIYGPGDALTNLVRSYYVVANGLLLAGAVACALTTRLRGDRLATVVQNVALLVVTLVWGAIVVVGGYLPYMDYIRAMRTLH